MCGGGMAAGQVSREGDLAAAMPGCGCMSAARGACGEGPERAVMRMGGTTAVRCTVTGCPGTRGRALWCRSGRGSDRSPWWAGPVVRGRPFRLLMLARPRLGSPVVASSVPRPCRGSGLPRLPLPAPVFLVWVVWGPRLCPLSEWPWLRSPVRATSVARPVRRPRPGSPASVTPVARPRSRLAGLRLGSPVRVVPVPLPGLVEARPSPGAPVWVTPTRPWFVSVICTTFAFSHCLFRFRPIGSRLGRLPSGAGRLMC